MFGGETTRHFRRARKIRRSTCVKWGEQLPSRSTTTEASQGGTQTRSTQSGGTLRRSISRRARTTARQRCARCPAACHAPCARPAFPTFKHLLPFLCSRRNTAFGTLASRTCVQLVCTHALSFRRSMGHVIVLAESRGLPFGAQRSNAAFGDCVREHPADLES